MTGWLLVAGSIFAGAVSLLASVAGLLALQKALAGQGVAQAAGLLAAHLALAVLAYVISRKLMAAGKARLGEP